MRSVQSVIAQCFRDTLINEALITGLVGDKVYWERVEQTIAFPYITMHHISGGDENCAQTQYVDSVWKIVGHSDDQPQCTELVNAIYTALYNKLPVANDDARGYTTIEEVMPLFDSYQVQNIPFNVVGGLYRIRLHIAEVR